jgi:GAF domain-containing protein
MGRSSPTNSKHYLIEKRMPFNEVLQRTLDETAFNLHASSCTLYLHDPQWPGEWRLIAMTGVRFQEPMYGFVYGGIGRSMLETKDRELFISLRDVDEPETRSLSADIEFSNLRLFGNFQQRERVSAFARLTKTVSPDECRLVLFVNFQVPISFSDTDKLAMRKELDRLTDAVREIRFSLVSADLEWRSEATRIASPRHTTSNLSTSALEQPETFFSTVIEATLTALNVPSETGWGVIHLYNAELQVLQLRGSFGAVDSFERARDLSVKIGEGLSSWVALTKRSLLIEDLTQSQFKRIHVSLNDNTHSALVVPLEIDGELVGTMCLESTDPGRFVPHHALSVWFAANKAAIAYQLHQLSSMNRKLLDLCWRATSVEGGARVSLDDLATLAKDYLIASSCEISRYNSESLTFDRGGASYENFIPQVRRGGWTDFIRSRQAPVWISEIQGPGEPKVHVWQDDDWRPAHGENFPTGINASALEGGVRAALGIPIIVRGDCVGVAWTKYKRPHPEPPKHGLMALALGFAAEAGLVFDSIQRRDVDLKEKEKIDSVADQVAAAIQDRWQLSESPLVECSVLSLPLHSRLGGDFYAGKVIDSRTVGILLVDGQGHGVGGSLHMLPLMTAFESVYDSYSPAHVVSQLAKTAGTLGIRGSAIYCILSSIDGHLWLSVTTAGHESLILFKRIDRGRWDISHFPNSRAPMLGHPISEPFMDERVRLSSGDVMIGYTDGIAEHDDFNANHVSAVVANLLNENSTVGTDVIASAVVEESRRKQLGFGDDATIFVARVK